MVSETIFETRRLRCRHWLPEDLPTIHAVYGDPAVVRWVDDGEPISFADCERWMTVTQSNYDRRGYGMFALEARASGEIVGFCGLVHPGDQETPEVKYAFAQSHWGRGLATECVSALLDCGVRRFGLTGIMATVASENEASRRVMLKVGAKHTDTITHGDGSLTDVFMWSAPARET